MRYGTNGTILRVNLTTGSISTDSFDEGFYRRYPGGKALAAYHLLREFPPGGDPLGPLLDRPALHLHAAPAVAAGQVVVVHACPALPVERLAAGIADGVDAALLAERLQMAVDGGEPDVLALAPQLRVDLLGAAEAGQALQRGRQGLRLPGPAGPGAPAAPRPRVLLRRRRHSSHATTSVPFGPTFARPTALRASL